MIKCRQDIPMYVKLVSHEQVNLKTTFEHRAKVSLILIENTVLLYLCDREEAALYQNVLNIIERELSQNGLTLHQHTEQK